MGRLLSVFVMISLFGLSACATAPAIDPIDVMGKSSCPWYKARSFCPDPSRWEKDLAGKWNRPYTVIEALIDRYTWATNDDDKTEIRNDYINEMFAMIDEEQLLYQNSVRQTKAFSEFFMDLSVLGLTAAGTVVGGAPVKAILSAAAAALTGTKLAVNKDFYQEASTSTILNHMDAARYLAKAEIRKRAKLKAHDYPLSEARADLMDYLFKGSIITAVKAIVENSTIVKKDAELKARQAAEGTPEQK